MFSILIGLPSTLLDVLRQLSQSSLMTSISLSVPLPFTSKAKSLSLESLPTQHNHQHQDIDSNILVKEFHWTSLSTRQRTTLSSRDMLQHPSNPTNTCCCSVPLTWPSCVCCCCCHLEMVRSSEHVCVHPSCWYRCHVTFDNLPPPPQQQQPSAFDVIYD